MAKEIKNVSVSFNMRDPYQKKMKEYVESFPNGSGYIKRLIQRDMEGGNAVKHIKKAPSQVVTNQSMMQSGFKLIESQNAAR